MSRAHEGPDAAGDACSNAPGRVASEHLLVLISPHTGSSRCRQPPLSRDDGDGDADDDDLVDFPAVEAEADDPVPLADPGVLESDNAPGAPSFEMPRGGGSSRIGCVEHHSPHADVTQEEAFQLEEAGYSV